MFFFFSSRRRHTRFDCDWSSDVCSSDLTALGSSVAHPAIKARQQKMTVLMTTGPCPNQPAAPRAPATLARSEEHTSELQSQSNLVCRLLLEKKNDTARYPRPATLLPPRT